MAKRQKAVVALGELLLMRLQGYEIDSIKQKIAELEKEIRK